MKDRYSIPKQLTAATETDFRKNGRLKLNVKYWYYCLGERKLVSHYTNNCTDLSDLKTRIAFKDVFILKPKN